MLFTLVDIESGNFLGGYTSEEQAFRDVLEIVERFGVDSREVERLSLAGDSEFGAEGRQLAALAIERLKPSAHRSVG